MDISRLPVAPLHRPASAPIKTNRQPALAEAAERLQPDKQPGRRAHEGVIQGKLLHREHTSYQSTHAFIDERRLEQAQTVGRQAESLKQARIAISRYLDNNRPEAAAEFSQDGSVNFFV